MQGLYIHIPFCASRCIYCDFYSTTHTEVTNHYIDCVCKEMRLRNLSRDSISKPKLRTIYIGGGTPSQLCGAELEQLFRGIESCYDISECIEITMECNPEDINDDYISFLRSLPINRLSFGIQSFDDDRLRFLRRRHDSSQAIRCVELSKSSGYENISIDLMFGFPGESQESWVRDIDKGLSLEVSHISAYSLMYSEGTRLTGMLSRGEIHELSDSLMSEMYLELSTRLRESGYDHYEISNFAKPGCRSVHNSSYWTGLPYIGIGAGAHSYNGKKRSYNIESLSKYIASIDNDELNEVEEELTDEDRYNEYVMLRLRRKEGICLDEMKKLFNEKHIDYFLERSKKHISMDNMIEDGDSIRIKEERFYVSDSIISDLFMV